MPTIATPERRKNIDFPQFFVWAEPYAMVVPHPEEEIRLFAFIRPFQPMVTVTLSTSDFTNLIVNYFVLMYRCGYLFLLPH